MKLKLFLITIFSVHCAPQSDNRKNIVIVSYRSEISEKSVELIKKFSIDFLIKVYESTVDPNCTRDKNESFGLLERFSFDNLNRKSDQDNIDDEEKLIGDRILSELSFAGVAMMCCTKLDAILEYTFETLLSHAILMRNSINETEFEFIAEIMKCANKYASDNKIVSDDEMDNLKFPMDQESLEKCNVQIDEAKHAMSKNVHRFATSEDNKQCFMNIIAKAETFIVKYVAMIQFELTDNQKRKERSNFIQDFRATIDGFMSCVAMP